MKNAHEPAAGLIEAGIHVLPLRVYYEDTDFSGSVYHATYLKFLERGRSEYLRALGVLHQELAAREQTTWAVKRIAVDYRRPAQLEDAITVHTHRGNVEGARVHIRQEIHRGHDILVTADVEVCLVAGGKPRRIPNDVRAKLAKSNL